MSTPSAMPWSPAQQAWLQAMGYTVLHGTALADALADEAAAAAADTAAHMRAPNEVVEFSSAPTRDARPNATAPQAATAELGTSTPRRAPPAVQAAPRPAVAPARISAGTRQPSVRLPDRLQIALLRASGLNPNDPATQTLMDTWPLDTLRGNGPAKRALWPQLRALRRRGAVT